MKSLQRLFENNRAWAERMTAAQPDYFRQTAREQTPEYLWIGCSDSRVPANEIVGLEPGELFVHRNVANLVVHTDLNCLTALQFAVDVIGVRHVIVCGHYGCGGINAALRNDRLGLSENWLRHVQDVQQRHAALLPPDLDDVTRLARLSELNVIEQVMNVGRTTIVQDAWARGQVLHLHGWMYRLEDGRLRDFGVTASGPEELPAAYSSGLARAGRPTGG